MFSYGTGRVMICLTKIQFLHMSRWPVTNVVILRAAQVCATLFVVVVRLFFGNIKLNALVKI